MIIHTSTCARNRQHHGCTGVGYDAFNAVKRELVSAHWNYNYLVVLTVRPAAAIPVTGPRTHDLFS